MTIGLTSVDWIIIAVYFVFIIGLGFYLKRFTRTQEDFFIAGRKNSAWVAGIAFLSANLGALELLGMAGNTYKYGMYVAHFYWIGAIPAMVFLGVYMMPFYYSSRIHSVPGYLKLRFDEKTRVLNAFAFGAMTLLVSGINLYAMALVLHTFLGWNWDVSMWLSAIAVAVYITMSGLLSAIFTEIIQFFLIWFGLFLVAILGIVEVGGVREIFARVPASFGTLWSTSANASQNGMAITFLVIITGLVALVLANDPKSGFTLLRDGGQINYDSALPLLIQRYYPAGLMGLGITALLAAFMAGQAGNVSAFNTVWTYDIYRALINKNASDQHLLWMGRITTLIGIVLSVGTAYWAKSFPSIMDYMQAIFSWVNAPLFATMLLGMFVWWITPAGAFWGLLAGMGSSFSLFLAVKFQWINPAVLTLSSSTSDMAANFWRAWWAWLICFIVTIAISAFTRKRPRPELVGLVKGLTEGKAMQAAPFFKSPEFYGLLSIIVLVALNIYFW
jgi:SSS family solute:Na+ symporter